MRRGLDAEFAKFNAKFRNVDFAKLCCLSELCVKVRTLGLTQRFPGAVTYFSS